MDKKKLSKEECIDLYYAKDKSFRDISKVCGYSDNHVRKLFKKYNIKSRSLSESCKLRCNLKPQTDISLRLRQEAKEKLKQGHKYFNRSMSQGYWRLYIPLKGWKKEHVYFWEQKHGEIPKGYVIHHIDEDKLNNDLNNLKLLSKAEHHKLHYKDMIICRETGRIIKKNG